MRDSIFWTSSQHLGPAGNLLDLWIVRNISLLTKISFFSDRGKLYSLYALKKDYRYCIIFPLVLEKSTKSSSHYLEEVCKYWSYLDTLDWKWATANFRSCNTLGDTCKLSAELMLHASYDGLCRHGGGNASHKFKVGKHLLPAKSAGSSSRLGKRHVSCLGAALTTQIVIVILYSADVDCNGSKGGAVCHEAAWFGMSYLNLPDYLTYFLRNLECLAVFLLTLSLAFLIGRSSSTFMFDNFTRPSVLRHILNTSANGFSKVFRILSQSRTNLLWSPLFNGLQAPYMYHPMDQPQVQLTLLCWLVFPH